MDKYLIIQGARFGDLLQSARLILSLKQLGEVHIVLDASLEELARLAYPDIHTHGVTLHHKLDAASLAKNEKIFGELRATRFARIYNCNFSPLTGAIARLFESSRIVGYRPAYDSAGGQLRSSWLRLAFRLSENRAATPLNLVDLWSWFASAPVPAASVNMPAQPGGGGLGVAVAGRVERRSIPLEVLASCIEIASKILGVKTIKLFGASQENQKANRLLRLLSPKAVVCARNLCGRTDWRQLFEEMRGLDLLLTPDTGLMHLAVHLGVPVMAFFLSSAWCHETGPYGAGHLIWQTALACAPCLEAAPCQHNLVCKDQFADPLFARAFASAITGKKLAPLPNGLQLWRTDFDDLGLRLELIGGQDSQAQTRNLQRDYLREYLGMAHAAPDDLSAWNNILQKLEPDKEWMLPPFRYCQ